LPFYFLEFTENFFLQSYLLVIKSIFTAYKYFGKANIYEKLRFRFAICLFLGWGKTNVVKIKWFSLVVFNLTPWAPRYWRYFFNCHALLAFFNCRFLWLLPWINLGANINTNTLRYITGTKYKHSCELIYRTCLNLIRLA